MEFVFHARGHFNVSSTHKTTFEVTMDREIGENAHCILGVSSDAKLNDLPIELREAIKNGDTTVKVKLETENGFDEIKGYGHPDLTLDHPTDMVCRKSEFICSRTLMIKADKAAIDIKSELIHDLKVGKDLKVTIIVE